MVNSYKDDIGKIIYSKHKKHKGSITNVINRWCAGCQSNGPCYSVLWEDGVRSYPCPAGVKTNNDGTLEIE